MSRYDGLIIPRSYSEYLNKTDSATLSQMLQHLTGLWSHAVSAGDNKPVTSNAVNDALANYINKTDAATLQQALQLPGVLSEAVDAGDNKAVKSSAVYEALTNYINKTDAATLSQALQLPGVLSGAVAADDNKAVKSSAVNAALANKVVTFSTKGFTLSSSISNPIRRSGKVIVINLYGFTTKVIAANTVFITNLPPPATDFHLVIENLEIVITTAGDLYCTSEIPSNKWFVSEIVYIEA